MIKKDYVSRETYNLLKEKGYDGEFKTCYDIEGYAYHAIHLYDAIKWFRKTYNFNISISIGTDGSSDADGKIVEEWSFWTYLIESTYGNVIYDACAQFDPVEYQSYEESCEAAIKYCLENLV